MWEGAGPAGHLAEGLESAVALGVRWKEAGNSCWDTGTLGPPPGLVLLVTKGLQGRDCKESQGPNAVASQGGMLLKGSGVSADPSVWSWGEATKKMRLRMRKKSRIAGV